MWYYLMHTFLLILHIQCGTTLLTFMVVLSHRCTTAQDLMDIFLLWCCLMNNIPLISTLY